MILTFAVGVYDILSTKTFLAFLLEATRCVTLLLLTSELVAVADAAADAAAGRVSLPVPCHASARSSAAVVAVSVRLRLFAAFPYDVIVVSIA